MKDIVLLNVRRLAEAYIRQVDKDNTLIACRNLLQLSYKKGLLHKNPFDEKGDLNIDTVIKESDLTDLFFFTHHRDKRFLAYNAL